MFAYSEHVNPAVLYIGLFATTVFCAVGIALNRTKRRPFPPGPPGKPIIGNILEVSPTGGWIPFTHHGKKYGDLVFFRGLGNSVLVLNSLNVIYELLDKRGITYSHRPTFTVVGELMGLGQSMPLLPYGNEWREHRKLAHLALSPFAVKKYHGLQEDLSALLCRDLIKQPDDFFALVRLTAGRIILSVTYGLSVNTVDNEYITHAEETMKLIGKATVPGAFICDFLPWLKHLPGWIPFKQEAAKGRVMIEDFVTKPFNHVKRDMDAGIACPSLTNDLLSSAIDGSSHFEHRVKWTTGAMYGAGGETTYATVLTFIMAMALYPEKQRLAQTEIDTIIGTNRLPTIGDRQSLVYINAVIKETMRWHPALPLSIARRTAQDDVYDGYFIPKDTIVMPNVWAIAFSPNDTYDPRKFIPERFLDPNQVVTDPSVWAFGFGRRVCPGKALAENSVFIIIATILSCLDISPPIDDVLTPEFELNLVSYPKPYKCRIAPRSLTHESLVNRRASACEV